VSSLRKTYLSHLVCGNGKRKSRRSQDLPCHTIQMISLGFEAPQTLSIQTYCPHADPFLPRVRRRRNSRNGVRLADSGQGDAPDAKHDRPRFPSIRSVVGFCNGRLYFSSVKSIDREAHDNWLPSGSSKLSKVNGLSVSGPVRIPPRDVSPFPQR